MEARIVQYVEESLIHRQDKITSKTDKIIIASLISVLVDGFQIFL